MTLRARTPSSFEKRIIFWGSLLLAAALAFFALVIVLAPKIINQEAVRSKIEATISKELGGTVTVDRVGLVLFPRPVIELQELKIEVPGTASASIAALRIYARFLPLLQGRFDVSSVTLDRPVLTLVLPDGRTKGRKRAGKQTKKTDRTVDSVLAVAGREMPDLSLEISRGRLSLVRDGEKVLSFDDLEAELAFVPAGQGPKDPSGGAPGDDYRIAGSAGTVLSGKTALPGPLTISISRFDISPRKLVVARSRARLLDMDMTLSGSVTHPFSTAPGSDTVFSGSIGQDAADWIGPLAGLPDEVMVQAPLKVTNARLRTSGTGSSMTKSLTGSATVKDGTAIALALRHEPDLLSIEKLQVKDSESDAVLRLTSGKEGLDLAFTGNLTGATLSRILSHEQMPFRRITGDIQVHLPRDQWSEATADGTLEGEGLIVSSLPEGALVVDRFSARGDGRSVALHPAVLLLGQDIVNVDGTATLSGAGVALDLDVSSDRISMRAIQGLVERKKKESGTGAAESTGRKMDIKADLRIRAAAVTFPSYTAHAVDMTLSMARDRTTADLEHASLCGIDLKGSLRAGDHDIEISVEPRVRGGKLDESLRCILHEDLQFTGEYDLSGRLTGRGPWERLLRSLQGDLELTARQGRILSGRVVKGVIVYLNSTSLFKDSRASLLKEGVPYERIVLRGALREGVISLSEGSIRSRELHITADGSVDLREGTLALNVLAAPFTTMDRLLSKIPLVKQLAGNALIVVPVRIEGTFQEPKVKPLPVSGVGTNISNLMKNIVQVPVKIIEPVLPKEPKEGLAPGKEQP